MAEELEIFDSLFKDVEERRKWQKGQPHHKKKRKRKINGQINSCSLHHSPLFFHFLCFLFGFGEAQARPFPYHLFVFLVFCGVLILVSFRWASSQECLSSFPFNTKRKRKEKKRKEVKKKRKKGS